MALPTTPRPALGPLPVAVVDRLRGWMHAGKAHYGRRLAREIAADRRATGTTAATPYRCPFCGWWHVGVALSQQRMTELAQYLRFGVEQKGTAWPTN